MSCVLGDQKQTAWEDELLALTEQLEEIEVYQGNSKGNYRVNHIPDNEAATQVFLDEVTAHFNRLNDLQLARSIAHAVNLDGPAISAIRKAETQAETDRRLAIRTSANDPTLEKPPIANETSGDCPAPQENSFCMITRTFGSNDIDEENDAAGPSVTYAQRQEEKEEVRCCVCYDEFPLHKMIRLKCSHLYCVDCMKGLFLRATKDESLYPPRCCREPIPLLLIQTEMSEQELEVFNSAEIEHSTTERTYCSNMQCRMFIPPGRITADEANCPFCGSSTCTMCKKAFHQDDCPEDTALQATLSLASREGWQRCFSCRRLVELGMGCYHITCKCRAQFCYLCGAKWRSCSCEGWDEQRLVERAEEVLDREATQALMPHDREIRVVQMQENLRENHECGHPGRFQRISGIGGGRPFVCEICEAAHWRYILQCRRCYLQVCQDCRRHRI
ncbi:hypothetical protein P170DRAFT_357626 [Aspergillus steynii IBT 23096]|uniref:RBR-type E3 ubiquitin transferase n=1 Tax=Aspergillus steynii IBT 23096 TaxID=1392250 RepID=A0A2I2G6X0_9EURO|nr:uncharacterized protein P170DRAFT_357626 [Aspergillus steynii IBT 23096]PLB48622.1 hypothetical protein P170DRAFT_357626 [Aspergillus steynii IBT 23096]